MISGRPMAWMPAHWMARNWPESVLSLTSAKARTASSLPHTQPSRQPVMLKALESEWTSTATSSAPGSTGCQGLLAVKDQGAVGGVVDHKDPVPAGEVDDVGRKTPGWPRRRWGCWGS